MTDKTAQRTNLRAAACGSSRAPWRVMGGCLLAVVLAACSSASGTPSASSGRASSGSPSSPAPWIAYQSVASDGSCTLRLVHPDGSGDHAVLSEATTHRQLHPDWNQLHPDWSPDGKSLVYGLGDDIDTKQLWRVNVDGSGARQLPIPTEATTDLEAPRWSPDGRSIAFVRLNQPAGHDPFMNVQKIDVATGAVTTIYTPPPGVGTWWISWSPDGRRLVVDLVYYPSITDTTVIGSSIAVVDLTQSNPKAKALTPPSMFASYPDWNRTGDRIVFNTRDLVWRGTLIDQTAPSDLYTIRPDGSGLQQLTHNPHGSTVHPNTDRSGPVSAQPTWAPDGRSIYFVQIDGVAPPRFSIATVAPDGTGLKAATSTGFVFMGTHPRLQPTHR
jgi:Tol biopolymer transport system component